MPLAFPSLIGMLLAAFFSSRTNLQSPPVMNPLLIYIHGFLSSPLSVKAELTCAFIEQQKLPIDFIAPGLSDYPTPAHQSLQQIIEENSERKIALIGSSLGGFMATVLAEQYDLRAVLVNPAVHPYRLMEGFLGEHINPYTHNRFVLGENHVEDLRTLEVKTIAAPSNLLVMLQTGDETLDYRLAVDYYQGCTQQVEAGGTHSFENFEKHLPAVLKFLELC